MTFIIADYQDVTRFGLIQLIMDTFGDDVQIMETRTLSSLSSLLAENKEHISVVVADCLGSGSIELPIEEIQKLANDYPHIAWVLFSNEIPEFIISHFAANGHFSLLPKQSCSREITLALEYAVRGERFICQRIMDILLNASHNDSLGELTETETEILRLTAQGKSVKMIANERHSSIYTITTHKRNIFRKLGINTSREATRYAVRAGLVDLIEYYI